MSRQYGIAPFFIKAFAVEVAKKIIFSLVVEDEVAFEDPPPIASAPLLALELDLDDDDDLTLPINTLNMRRMSHCTSVFGVWLRIWKGM